MQEDERIREGAVSGASRSETYRCYRYLTRHVGCKHTRTNGFCTHAQIHTYKPGCALVFAQEHLDQNTMKAWRPL